MNTVIDLATRRDLGLEERVARARRARAAQAEAAVRRQAQIRSKARVALTTILTEQVDPQTVA